MVKTTRTTIEKIVKKEEHEARVRAALDRFAWTLNFGPPTDEELEAAYGPGRLEAAPPRDFVRLLIWQELARNGVVTLFTANWMQVVGIYTEEQE